EAVEADAQEGPEAGARRIERHEEALLERAREELLRQVGRLLVVRPPLEAEVVADRLPIGLDERLPADAARLRVGAADRLEDRKGSRRKCRRRRRGKRRIVGCGHAPSCAGAATREDEYLTT